MDKNIIELLEFLKPHGLGREVECSEKIDALFPFPSNETDYEIEKKIIFEFLRRLREHQYITYNPNSLYISPFDLSFPKWFPKGIKIGIIIAGLNLLEEHNNNLISNDLNISAIDTNKSIIATNISVQDTNRTVVNLSKNQSDILKRQTLIFLFTAIFAFGSLAMAGINMFLDIRKNTAKKQLQQQSQEIDTLQHQLSQAKNELYHLKEAKKTSQKKL